MPEVEDLRADEARTEREDCGRRPTTPHKGTEVSMHDNEMAVKKSQDVPCKPCGARCC